MSEAVLAHFSDIHFGRHCELARIAAAEECLPSLAPSVIVLSGDLGQRARHGEFQAARRWLDGVGRLAPVLVIPGNHDVQWWRSPFGLLGRRALYGKYRRYQGEDLTPTLELDGLTIVSLLSAHGLALGSLTWNPNDLTVKGHLPTSEVRRAEQILSRVPPHHARIVALHHNVLPGVVSRRWGLARPLAAQRALLSLGADLVLCGHDHTEGAGRIAERLVVSTCGTLSDRTRGGPAAFNMVRIDQRRIEIQHYLYDSPGRGFQPGAIATFPRPNATGAVEPGR